MKRVVVLGTIVLLQLLVAPSFSGVISKNTSSIMPTNGDYSNWNWEIQNQDNWKRFNETTNSWGRIQPPFGLATERVGELFDVYEKRDYTKAKGWQLLWAQFDRYPYFILYNTHRSLIRVFFYLEDNPYDHVLATLSYHENLNNPGILSLANESGYANSTDDYYNNSNALDDVYSVIVEVGSNCWCSVDFNVLFDDYIRDNKYKNKSWVFAFYGCDNFNIHLSSTNYELGKQFSFTTNSSSISVGKGFEAKFAKVDKNIKSAENFMNQMEKSVKNIDNSSPQFLQDYKKHIENAKFMQSTISTVSSFSSAIGVIVSFVNVFKGIIGSESATMATNSVQQPLSLSGTMTIKKMLGGNTLKIPGVQNSNTYGLNWNPYNCPMGVINLKKTPSIKVTTPYLKVGLDEPTTKSKVFSYAKKEIDQTYSTKYNGKMRKYKFDDDITLVQQKIDGLKLLETKVAIVCKPNGSGNKLYHVNDKYLCRYNYYSITGALIQQIPFTNPVYKALSDERFVIHKFDESNNEVYYGTPYMSVEELRGVVFEVPEDTDVKLAIATFFSSKYYDEPIIYKVLYNINEIEEPAKLKEIGGTQEQTNFLFSEYYNTQYSLILNTEQSNINEAVNITLKNGFIGKNGFTAKAIPLTKGFHNGKLTIDNIDFNCEPTLSNRKMNNSILTCKNSINEKNVELIKIHPNPSSDVVNISSSEPISQVLLYNINGNLIYKITDINSYETILNLDECLSGTYIVVIIDENNQTYKQQIIVNK